MTDEQKAQAIAQGLVDTGVEGGFGAVSQSTAGDYPSIGCSQWEGLGGRGDLLLSYIDGGAAFANRTYSDLKNTVDEEDVSDIDKLSALLDSPQGQAAQLMIIASDCQDLYLPALADAGLTDDRCVIYCAIWCPTSHAVVRNFLKRRAERGYDINCLETLRDLFHDEYSVAAGYADDADVVNVYANRAYRTYEYVAGLEVNNND